MKRRESFSKFGTVEYFNFIIMSTICLNKVKSQGAKILLNPAVSHHFYDSVPSQKESSLSKSVVLKRINIGKLPTKHI